MQPIKTLVIYGSEEKISDEESVYNLKSKTRDDSQKHSIDLKENDKLLELVLEDGTSWMCDAATLHEVFPEIDPALNLETERGQEKDEFELPVEIQSNGNARGFIGKVVVALLKIFTKTKTDEKVGDIAKRLEDQHLLTGIPGLNLNTDDFNQEKYLNKGAGLFSVDREFRLIPFEKIDDTDPYFLFVHGTNSNTLTAFEGLKQTTAWNTLHETYGKNVLAFQHRTLTESPLENTTKLAKLLDEKLPNKITLHLLTHSRGGIIGDILNKYCSNEGEPIGFSKERLNQLIDDGNREDDVEQIRLLNKLFKKKRITISRFIRVASPAAGTVLASKRLDHMLNVLFNFMGGGIFGDILKELLSYAVNHKDNIEILPGLEAQNPDSPFMEILNDPSDENAVDGSPLAVISGNANVGVSKNGLLALLGHLFFWKRNDLVVNTDSMYLGVRRKNEIQYYFDEGSQVNHFKFFENHNTAEAIRLAIQTELGNEIPGFKSVLQYEVPKSDRALEYGELEPVKEPPSGKKPIVVLLPGIMGSNLTRKEKEIWLHYGQLIFGGLGQLKYSSTDGIEATSVVRSSYFKLYKWLSAKYDVVVYPFDWRKPLQESAASFNAKIQELLKVNQPIKIIGHSMGGVLVRDFVLAHPNTWQQLNTSNGFRLLFLGSPLGGSHRILTVLFGKDDIIRKLSKIDAFHSKRGLLKMFTKFPGILGLLPLTTDKNNDFAIQETWEKMREVFGKNDWPLPPVSELNRFKKYRENILAKRESIDYTNMVYIAGKDKLTPCGYYLDEIQPRKELYFLYTSEGDQSVTWELGIPKELKEKEAVYYSRVTHGALANEPDLFQGIEDILSNGTTTRLLKHEPKVRGEKKLIRTEPDLDFDLSVEGLERSVLALGAKGPRFTLTQVPLKVRICAGDLRYATYPILAGHFLNDGILYAESAINFYLDGQLADKHSLELYPGAIGSSAIFQNQGENDFAGAIIVGMGDSDNLTSLQLSNTVEKGVLNYLLSGASRFSSGGELGISSLIISCGFGGLSIENSMKGIIDGINQANEKVSSLDGSKHKTIKHLEFIELYSNRALQAMYALNRIVRNENESYNISLENKKIKSLLGVKRSMPLDIAEEWWNRITVKYRHGDKETGEAASMVFGASTRDAREEENEIFSSTPLIDLFISEASVKNQWNPKTAKTLFELLIPNALKDKLKRKGNISWIVDSKTASYPWELLQDSTQNAKPLCINTGMTRQLSISDYRLVIKRGAAPRALVIADPILEGFIGQLPGAKDEGHEVEKAMQDIGFPVQAFINAKAPDIVDNLFSEEYSIVHFAGHGIFNTKNPKKSGMVIGKDIFLTVFDIKQLTTVPQLVFVNCCHLGLTSMTDEKYYKERYKLAANFGTELIRIGVKAVVAAGWAVNDMDALDFAKEFYKHMFEGDCFGDAIKKARNFVYRNQNGSNTWGAYQCYGDPFFRIEKSARKVWNPEYIVPEEAECDIDNMLNDIEMGIKSDVDYLGDLEKINKAVQRDITETAGIIQRQADVYYELGEYEKAVDRFEIIFKLEQAEFSFSTMKKYCNARAKLYVQNVYHKGAEISEDKEKYYDRTLKVIDDLKRLIDVGETATRLNMMGSTYKRLAMLAGNEEERLDALNNSMEYYNKAAKISQDQKGDTIYSLTNAIEISSLLTLSQEKKNGQLKAEDKGYKLYTLAKAKRILNEEKNKLIQNADKNKMSYWDMLAFLNIDLCLLMIQQNKKTEEKKWKEIVHDFNMVWEKAGSEGKKISELEHLKFIIYVLKKISSEANNSFLPYKKKVSIADLGLHIEELRTALKGLK